MKKTTLLTCLALTGVLGLSSTAYASEVSVQSLIDGSSQTEAENQPEAENEQTETETPSTENTDDTNTVSVQTENTEASGTAAQKSGEHPQTDRLFPELTCMMQVLFPLTPKFPAQPQKASITGMPLPPDLLQEQNIKSPVLIPLPEPIQYTILFMMNMALL